MVDDLPVCSCGRIIPRSLISGVVRCACGATYGNKTSSKMPQDESEGKAGPSTRGKAKTTNLDDAGAISDGYRGKGVKS